MSRNQRYAELIRIAGRHRLIPFTISTATDSAEARKHAVRDPAALEDAVEGEAATLLPMLELHPPCANDGGPSARAGLS